LTHSKDRGKLHYSEILLCIDENEETNLKNSINWVIILLILGSCSTDSEKEADQKELETALLIQIVQSQKKPDCEKYSTATVYFINSSNSSSTYDILWDGTIYTSVSPNSKSIIYTVASGFHTLLFRLTNSSTSACTQSSLNLAICSSM
jgi:hypothetical protein